MCCGLVGKWGERVGISLCELERGEAGGGGCSGVLQGRWRRGNNNLSCVHLSSLFLSHTFPPLLLLLSPSSTHPEQEKKRVSNTSFCKIFHFLSLSLLVGVPIFLSPPTPRSCCKVNWSNPRRGGGKNKLRHCTSSLVQYRMSK